MWFLSVIAVAATATAGLIGSLSKMPIGRRVAVIALTLISVAAIGLHEWWGAYQKETHEAANTAAIAAVGKIIEQGSQIQQDFLNTNDAAAIKSRYADWMKKSSTTLGMIDQSYEIAFQNAPNVSSMPLDHSIEGGSYWAAIEGRKIVLSDVMKELRQSR